MMQVDQALTLATPVYRYLSVESFVAFTETGRTVLTNINNWDDGWEAILAKVPIVDENGKPSSASYSFHQDTFGQSWTLLEESDAMWRIYSTAKTGLRIQTSVGKFGMIVGVNRSHVGIVQYFRDVPELLAMAELRTSPFDFALVKRAAFSHEREVRYLTNGQFLTERVSITAPRVTQSLDPKAFIEGVVVDPRADDWYLEAMVGYAKRVGLRCVPTRSTLYEPDPHLHIGVTRQWKPVASQAVGERTSMPADERASTS